MFTGIISDIGRLAALEERGDRRLVIETRFDTATIDLGASIACDGVCLTVVEKAAGRFAVDVSAETLSKTTLGGWREGHAINLERSMRLGDEIGGHLVYGHVDGLATVVAAEPEGGSVRWRFEVPEALARFIAPKGSVALNGVSLTVNEVDGAVFGVNIIPHTQAMTTFTAPGDERPGVRVGDSVNLEVDMLARYVARLNEWSEHQG
ncbi:MAG: riboflavin synthase [Azospirillaceae bacterium]